MGILDLDLSNPKKEFGTLKITKGQALEALADDPNGLNDPDDDPQGEKGRKGPLGPPRGFGNGLPRDLRHGKRRHGYGGGENGPPRPPKGQGHKPLKDLRPCRPLIKPLAKRGPAFGTSKAHDGDGDNFPDLGPPDPYSRARDVALSAKAMREVRKCYAARQVKDALRRRNGSVIRHTLELPIGSQESEDGQAPDSPKQATSPKSDHPASKPQPDNTYDTADEVSYCHLTEEQLETVHKRFGHPAGRFAAVLKRATCLRLWQHSTCLRLLDAAGSTLTPAPHF
ncbi:hypothetical protein LZ554_009575 [Drepanopeziza brunnea f. sp. 'monogermtubi']|nr:hypothetical protein LZ554_009575 [Drepanopeziza brunnea f. sp. 'monogermtubi']